MKCTMFCGHIECPIVDFIVKGGHSELEIFLACEQVF